MVNKIEIILLDKELTQNEQEEIYRDISDLLEDKEINSCITFHKTSN